MARDPTQDTGDRALAPRLSPISIRFQPNKQLYLEKKYKPYKAANNAHGHLENNSCVEPKFYM